MDKTQKCNFRITQMVEFSVEEDIEFSEVYYLYFIHMQKIYCRRFYMISVGMR